MKITDTSGSDDFEEVDDVLDGFNLTHAERSRIEYRTAGLLALDACLRDLRVAAGIRQTDVARAMDVTKSAVSQLEARGMLDAKLSTLTRYFAGLGYQLEITLTPIDA